MKPGDYAIVGASESTKIGKVEELSGMTIVKRRSQYFTRRGFKGP